MQLAARLDDYGKPAWIAVMVLGFIVFWPIGLAILAYLIWSGRMGCWRHGGPGRWHRYGTERESYTSNRWGGGRRRAESSGNGAFDDYREETLRRLEEEQEEFHAFLERLRHAKDKAEFDQFMAGRKDGAGWSDAPGTAPGAAPDVDDGPAPQPQT